MFRFAIRNVLCLLVVVGLGVIFVVQARSAALARLESFRRVDKSDNLLLDLLAELEEESRATVTDDWYTITVKTKSGKILVFPIYSREGRQPWTK
jgi:hypothetical protein